MSNKKRIFCCVISVLVIFCCALFTACTPTDVDETEASTAETSAVVTTTAETEPVTTESKNINVTLSESYVPAKAHDENGAEVGLDTVYGTGLYNYGGSLCFKDDGTFTTFIGVYGNTDNESGTYKIISDTEIEMIYNNDTVKIAVITQTDSAGIVTELRMPHRSHDVVFSQE